MHGDPVDFDKFRVTDEEMATIAAERRAKKSSNATATNRAKSAPSTFVLYPIEQYTRIARAGHHGALALYGWLLYLNWKAGRRTSIKVTNPLAATVGLTRWTKGPALQKLEELGLVRVQRSAKKSPLVTLV